MVIDHGYDACLVNLKTFPFYDDQPRITMTETAPKDPLKAMMVMMKSAVRVFVMVMAIAMMMAMKMTIVIINMFRSGTE